MGLNRAQLLLLQRDHAWSQEEWIVPLAVALDGVTAETAAWEPKGGGNSIWQTMMHINYYNDRLLRRLAREPFGTSGPSNDATFEGAGSAADEEGWRKTVSQTHATSARIREVIAGYSDEDLDKPYGPWTVGEQLAAWMLHDAYHSGQIVLIRKQLGKWRA